MDSFSMLHHKQPLHDHPRNSTCVSNEYLFLTRYTEKLVTYTLALDHM